MAINFYGACTGKSGSQYDIWINARQNSQDISENKSNITIKLYLKRNDGYKASAYNLTKEDNTASLSIGGDVVVSKNLVIDTRNLATVTLASWTGDVEHNTDGSLEISVSGEFTLAGTSLSGGSVSGSFSLTDIPRSSSLTMDKTSVVPEESVGFTISAASSAFKHKIVLSLGTKSTSVTVSAGVKTASLTVPLSWAEQIPTSTSKNMAVTLTTYKGSVKIGKKSYSLKLKIPSTSEFLPGFSISLTRIDGDVPAGFNEYVRNKSKVSVNTSSVSLKHGATLSAVSVKIGSITKKSVPAEFSLTDIGSVTISVTIKDSRGYSTKKTKTITVCDYKTPSISVKSFYRCKENGAADKDGTSLYVSYNLKYSPVNDKNIPVIKAKYRKNSQDSWTGTKTLTGDGVVFKNVLESTSSYEVLFLVSDSITTTGIEFIRILPSANIPFNIKSGGNGAAFGCYAENENELRVNWDVDILGSLKSRNVSFSANTAVIENEYVLLKYIPCLNLCFFRLRADASTKLLGGTTYVIGSSEKIPGLFTPLSVYFASDTNTLISAGIRSSTGEVVLRFDKDVEKSERFYMAGMFLCDSTA